jgi:hypothetical protein
MSRRKRRAKAAKPAAAAKLVELKPPAACGPFKRGGRRYVPSPEGTVAVPAGLVDDLIAHGFAPLGDGDRQCPPAGDKTTKTRGGDYGG